MSAKLTREEQAALEAGHTAISPVLAKWLVVCFLIPLFAVPFVQLILDDAPSLTGINFAQRNDSSFFSAVTGWNNQVLQNIDRFESNLEEESFLRDLLFGYGQRILLTLGYGNEKVYLGEENWLFYRPDMDYLMNQPFLDKTRMDLRRTEGKTWEPKIQPDPLLAIQEFQQQLKQQGIELILLPTPVKGSIHPEYFFKRNYSVPLQNRSWSDFIMSLKEKDVLFFDPTVLFTELRNKEPAPLYLQTDTHWQPEGMEAAAEELAGFISRTIPLSDSSDAATVFLRKEQTVSNRGDIDAMLLLPDQLNPYAKETVTIHPVVRSDNILWQPDSEAEVLLLGDSFSNIYSLAGMGWGAGAGFAEQLSYYLQRPIDVITQNDAGAAATREILSRDLARGRNKLANKKVVVWQFAARELSSGDWKKINMTLQDQPVESGDFYAPEPGESVEVRALVAAVSNSPLPGSVPYKDNIITLHLTDVCDIQSNEKYGQALVYAWGMRDNVLTKMADIRTNTHIEIRLIDWSSVEGQYSSYRRSTLDDEMLELELPVWGELLQ